MYSPYSNSTVVDGIIFLKNFKTITSEKIVRRGYYSYSGITMMKL